MFLVGWSLPAKEATSKSAKSVRFSQQVEIIHLVADDVFQNHMYFPRVSCVQHISNKTKKKNEMGRQRSDDERSFIPYTCWCLIDEVSYDICTM